MHERCRIILTVIAITLFFFAMALVVHDVYLDYCKTVSHHPLNPATQLPQENDPALVKPTPGYHRGDLERMSLREQIQKNPFQRNSGVGIAPLGTDSYKFLGVIDRVEFGGDTGVSEPVENPKAGFETKPASKLPTP